MDSLPLELIEHILSFCSGAQMSVCARVSTTWLTAKSNLERANRSLWRFKCLKEISIPLIESINTWRKPLNSLNENECKELYKKWFRSQRLHLWSETIRESKESFGTDQNIFRNVSALQVSGNVVISGHLSGRVHVTDVLNGCRPMKIVDHMSDVTDLALVNLVEEEEFRFLSDDISRSFSNHHHVISVGKDGRIYIALIGRTEAPPFEVCSRRERHYLKVRVSEDMFAVSAKSTRDISLFRFVVPKDGIKIDLSLKAILLRTISCDVILDSSSHWLGLFTFSDKKIAISNAHSRNSDLILSAHVTRDGQFEWSEVKELTVESEEDVTLATFCGFSFGNSVFFLFSSSNQILFSIDSKEFKVCPLHYWIPRSDKVLSLALFGSVLVAGTLYGHVVVLRVSHLRRLEFVDREKPLFRRKLSSEPIIKVVFGDNGFGPVLGAATAHKLFLVHWNN